MRDAPDDVEDFCCTIFRSDGVTLREQYNFQGLWDEARADCFNTADGDPWQLTAGTCNRHDFDNDRPVGTYQDSPPVSMREKKGKPMAQMTPTQLQHAHIALYLELWQSVQSMDPPSTPIKVNKETLDRVADLVQYLERKGILRTSSDDPLDIARKKGIPITINDPRSKDLIDCSGDHDVVCVGSTCFCTIGTHQL